MTARIIDFLRPDDPKALASSSTPKSCATTIKLSASAMPDSRVFYAVKANPAPEILKLLAELGSSFDCASVPEIDMALAAGATADRISYGNTIKKERDIAARLRARHPPLRGRLRRGGREDRPRRPRRARVLPHPRAGDGAEWPLSRKFGCEPEMAIDVLEHAAPPGLDRLRHLLPCRLAAADPDAWDAALGGHAALPHARDAASSSRMVNLGGGFPTKYLQKFRR